MTSVSWTILIKTVSEANSSEHWTKKAKRHKKQQFFVKASCQKHLPSPFLPCNVHLIRLSPRLLDDDNLRSALKYVRDEISEYLIKPNFKDYVSKSGKRVKLKGRCDSDPRITWTYDQKKNPIQAVEVIITAKE